MATVSRALTGRGRVSDETAKRVRELADQLGYHVNSVGKALREGSSRSVGMVVPVIGNPFYSSLIKAVEDELQLLDYELVIADSHGNVERETRRLGLLRSQQVQGILLVPASAKHSGDAVRALAPIVPIISVDRRLQDIEIDFVGVDNGIGIRLVLDHLVAQGVESIALASSDNVTSAGQERRRAFEAGAHERSLKLFPPVINAFDLETGLAAGTSFAEYEHLPDAIVAGDDLIAVGLISALAARGIQVPGDVLVTGFDGTYLAALVEPGITTVQQPIGEIASLAVQALMRRRGSSSASTIMDVTLPPTLIVRSSSRPARALT